jgi:hypothetical protein
LPKGARRVPRVTPPRRELSATSCVGIAIAFAAILSVAGHLFLSAPSLSFGARVLEGLLVLASIHVIGRAIDGVREATCTP